MSDELPRVLPADADRRTDRAFGIRIGKVIALCPGIDWPLAHDHAQCRHHERDVWQTPWRQVEP